MISLNFVVSKLKKTKVIYLGLFCLVFYFTFILRVHNYDRTPTSNHLDEMLYAWSGIYLIETGIPISWSTLDYPKRTEVFKGVINYKGGLPQTSVTLYKPWLDEPPLFSLLVGYFAHLYHADRTQFIPASYIRMPVVIIGTLTSVMVFLIAKFVSGYWTGLLAMLLYGITPLIVFASRTALPENLIALLFSIIVYLILRFQQQLQVRFIVYIPLIIGIAGLSKPTGFFLLPFVLFWVFLEFHHHKKTKIGLGYCSYLIAATIPFIVTFFLYGLYFDPEVFWRITSIQANRPLGFSSLAWFFISPAYDTAILKDSWYVFFLLAAAYFVFVPPVGKKRIIPFAFVYWVLIVMVSGGEGDLLPWYRFVAFPLLTILGAWGLQTIFKNADFFSSFFVVGFFLGSRYLLVNAFRPNISPAFFRLVLTATLAPALLNMIFDKKVFKTLTQVVIILLIATGAYFNVKYIYNRYEIVCENITCPMVPSTFLSSLHFPVLWRLLVLGPPAYR